MMFIAWAITINKKYVELFTYSLIYARTRAQSGALRPAFEHLHDTQRPFVHWHFSSSWNTSLIVGFVIQRGSTFPSLTTQPWSSCLVKSIWELQADIQILAWNTLCNRWRASASLVGGIRSTSLVLRQKMFIRTVFTSTSVTSWLYKWQTNESTALRRESVTLNCSSCAHSVMKDGTCFLSL